MSADSPAQPSDAPDPRRVLARMAFIRALGKYSDAIRDLHGRLAVAEPTDHYAGVNEVFWRNEVGPRRVQTVEDWARRWNLSAPWLIAWGAYALWRWEVGAACRQPRCARCRGTSWADPAAALERALLDGRLFLVGAPEPPAGRRYDPDNSPFMRYTGLSLLKGTEGIDVEANPLLETRAEFLDRAKRAWSAAVEALARQGISESRPRKLELHCEWLVRSRVLGETATTILKDFEDEPDDTALYHAVRDLARLIDLPITT